MEGCPIKQLALLTLLFTSEAFGWGSEGHQVVGTLAEMRLSPSIKAKIQKISGGESLAKLSTWPDSIKSGRDWEHSKPWHFVSIPDGMTYEECPHDENGDIIEAITHFTADLKNESLPLIKRKQALAFLVHFIGDIHQPLHVGRVDDMGGNLVKLVWKGRYTNLHSIWDMSIVKSIVPDIQSYSSQLNTVTAIEALPWEQDTLMTWVKEAMDLRRLVYTLPVEQQLGWEVNYEKSVSDTVKLRLQKTGVRLAAWLNKNLETTSVCTSQTGRSCQ